MEKLYYRTLIGFGVVFSALQFYDAGLDAHKGFYNSAIYSLVSAIFWIFLVSWFLKMEQDRRELKIHEEHFERTAKLIDEFTKAEMARLEKQHVDEMLQAVIKDITKGKKPTKAQLPKIEKAFHENIEDKWVRLSFENKDTLRVEVDKKPFTEVPVAAKRAAPGRSAAHDAAAKRGNAARAKITKPLTKSQERRIAATKKASK